MSTRRSIVWVDANGRTTQTLPTGSGSLGPLQTSLLAASNADVLNEFEATLNVNNSPSPIAATFQSVQDRAILQFQTGVGTVVKLTLPAPWSSIFLADQQTVDPANPLVSAIITAALAVLVDGAGNAVVAYLGGSRYGD